MLRCKNTLEDSSKKDKSISDDEENQLTTLVKKLEDYVQALEKRIRALEIERARAKRLKQLGYRSKK